MTSRSTRSTVTFARPFRLGDQGNDLPAGDYEVVVEEELIEGLSFDAYRRTGSFLMIRAGGATEMRPFDPSDLDAALGRDRAL